MDGERVIAVRIAVMPSPDELRLSKAVRALRAQVLAWPSAQSPGRMAPREGRLRQLSLAFRKYRFMSEQLRKSL